MILIENAYLRFERRDGRQLFQFERIEILFRCPVKHDLGAVRLVKIGISAGRLILRINLAGYGICVTISRLKLSISHREYFIVPYFFLLLYISLDCIFRYTPHGCTKIPSCPQRLSPVSLLQIWILFLQQP